MKKALSLLLALMMVVGLVMPQTWATGLQETEPGRCHYGDAARRHRRT